MKTRRQFILSGLSGTSLVSLSSSVPVFLPKTLTAANIGLDERRVLVVVELSGGNDGINTIVPFRDEGYVKHRTTLRLSFDSLIRLNDSLGLHPSMRALADVWNNGQLAIVQGVGYPNPNRSHFRSMEIWHSGVDASHDHYGLGWLGKGLDAVDSTTAGPQSMSVGNQATPLALRGRRTNSSSVQRLDQYLVSKHKVASLRRIAKAAAPAPSDDVLQFVSRTHAGALQMVEDLKAVPRTEIRRALYPATAFGRQLRLTARLIRAGLKTRVYYTQQTGYDTHAGQGPQHAMLLRDLSESVAAFLRDLEAARLTDRVVVMAFSEFGRRVAENGTDGTDHGTAGPVFLAGAQVAGGLHGQTPSLTNLSAGDLQMSVDFRRIYATVLGKWLRVPSTPALGRTFDPLPIIRG